MLCKRISYLCFAVFLFAASSSLFGQKPVESPTTDDAVKVTTSLVQIDVVVTDKRGQPVTGLSPEDFSIFQDGKLQRITNLAFVNSASSKTTIIRSGGKNVEKDPVPPPPPSNPGTQAGRMITFVLDDGNCLGTMDGLVTMREEMRKFIERDMTPQDRVAIYRTKGGASLTQLYTSNKEILLRELNRVNLIIPGFCGSTFEALRDKSTIKATGEGATSFESEADLAARRAREDRDREIQVIGTIGVLNYVVDRLKNVPQRKIVFLMSEGIMAGINTNSYGILRDLADKAARSSVVINTMSAKGMTVPGMLMAQDEVLPGITQGTDNTGPATEARLDEERALNEGIGYLAYATGGKFVKNTNALGRAVTQILDSNSGYYLIGYEPDDETFKGKSFHKIDVKVAKPELSVSFRNGFYGRPDKETEVIYKTADSPLYQAINMPLGENGIDIRLTTIIGNEPSTGNYVRTLFHIPGKDIALIDEPDGGKKAVFDVIAVVLDEKGKLVEEFNRTYPLRIPERGVDTITTNGIDFSSDIAIKKPGFYSLRIAVRDQNSNRIGSAGDYIEIPKAKESSFSITNLSSAVFSGDGKLMRPPARPMNAAFAPVFSLEAPAVRKYEKGSPLRYIFSVNNPKISSGTDKANLTRELRLYKNGELISTLAETAIEISKTTLYGVYESAGAFLLNDDLAPGEYVIQIIVRDKISNRISTQSLDFEVID